MSAENYSSSRRIAIIGGNGFVGSHVTQELSQTGNQCVGLERNLHGIGSEWLLSWDLKYCVPEMKKALADQSVVAKVRFE